MFNNCQSLNECNTQFTFWDAKHMHTRHCIKKNCLLLDHIENLNLISLTIHTSSFHGELEPISRILVHMYLRFMCPQKPLLYSIQAHNITILLLSRLLSQDLLAWRWNQSAILITFYSFIHFPIIQNFNEDVILTGNVTR
jgi:hypothetical protein